MLIITVGPLLLRVRQRRFDLFEPLVALCIATFVMFFLRPVAQLVAGEYSLRGYDVTEGFNKALVIAAVGTTVLLYGYFLGARHRSGRLRSHARSWEDSLCVRAAVLLALLSAVLYVTFLLRSGAAGSIVFSGADFANGEIWANSNAALYLGPLLAIPAILLLLQSWLETGKAGPLITAAMIGVVFALVTLPSGGREMFLILALPVAALPFLHRRTRPRWYWIALVLVLALVGSAFVRTWRQPTARTGGPVETLQSTLEHPAEIPRDQLLGPETEMFPALSLEASAVPSRIDFTPGRVVTSTLASLLPETVFSEKPRPPDAAFNEHFFPQQASVTRAGVATSYFGGVWFDSGFVGVAVGAAIVGFLFGRLWRYLMLNTNDPFARLLWAALLPFPVILLRGNPAQALPQVIYVVGPLVILVWYLRTTERRGTTARGLPARSHAALSRPDRASR